MLHFVYEIANFMKWAISRKPRYTPFVKLPIS